MLDKSDSQISFVKVLLADNYSRLFLGVSGTIFFLFCFIFHADFIKSVCLSLA